MTGLDFSQPAWFWLLLAPLFLGLIRRYRQSVNRLRRFAPPHLWWWIIDPPRQQPSGPAGYSRLLIACSLAIAAMSGPLLTDVTQRGQLPVSDVVIIVDISASMAAGDIQPSRLQRAKLELNSLLDGLDHHRIALVAFAANSYRLLPLTGDIDTVRYFLDALDTDMTRRQGSGLDQALAMGRKLLATSPRHSRAVILVTDGDTTHVDAAKQRAQELAQDDIPLLILGSGTTKGSPVPGRDGRYLRDAANDLVISPLQQALLLQLAAASHGRYINLSSEQHISRKLHEDLTALEQASRQPVVHTVYSLAPWLIGISLLLLLWNGQQQFRRGLALPVLAMLLLPPPGHAATLTQQAYQALTQGDYHEALQLYQQDTSFNGRIGLGAAHYRLQHYEQALKAFTAARDTADTAQQRSTALYNMANCLWRMKQTDQARRFYKQVLAIDPMHKQAAYNLNLIEALPFRQQAGRPSQTEQAVKRPDPNARSQGEQGQDTPVSRQQLQRALAEWRMTAPPNSDTGETASVRQQSRTQTPSPQPILRRRIARQDSANQPAGQEPPW